MPKDRFLQSAANYAGMGRSNERFIADNKLTADIHDRWIISENLCYNMPSTDTIARGQYSEVKRTANSPPFDEWWVKSKEAMQCLNSRYP